jgi:toxin ParE1/3/4
MSRKIERAIAEADLDTIAAYLRTKGGSRLSVRFLEAADAAIELLAELPSLGSPWQTGDPTLGQMRVLRIREFTNHLIFYQPIADGIEVTRVLHGAQDFEAIFGS